MDLDEETGIAIMESLKTFEAEYEEKKERIEPDFFVRDSTLVLTDCDNVPALLNSLSDRLADFKSLEVVDTVMINEEMVELFSLIPWLENVRIEGCCLTDTIVEEMVKLSNLKRLYLPQNDLRDASAVLIAQNCKLEELDLRENEIGDDGAIAIAQSLRKESLTTLDLSNNRNIQTRGVEALAEVLIDNASLKTLDLRGINLPVIPKRFLIRPGPLDRMDNVRFDKGNIEYLRSLRLRVEAEDAKRNRRFNQPMNADPLKPPYPTAKLCTVVKNGWVIKEWK